VFFEIRQLPCKFVPGFSKKPSFLANSFHIIPVTLDNDIERQKKLEADAVRIYSEPLLQNFLDEQRAAHPDIDLPDLPELGDLDICQVLSSPYFFA
jgi:DNA-directed RNA polymerase